MSRVVVYIDKAKCRDTEEIHGHDEVYILGTVQAFTSPQPIKAAFVAQDIDINDNEVKQFGPGAGIVFSANLPDNTQLQLDMTLMESDAAKDWQDWNQMLSAMQSALAVTPVGTIASATAAAASIFIAMDRDDRLGFNRQVFTVRDLPMGWGSPRQWTASEGGWFGYSTWDYTIYYWIGRFAS